MPVSREHVKFQCAFPANAFEAAASECSAFVREVLGSDVDPQRRVTLIIEVGRSDEADWTLLDTTLSAACHSRKLRERIVEDPAVTEIALPNSSRAVETLFHLLTHHALSLSWVELEPLCAVIAALDVPNVPTVLCQGVNGLLAAADCQGPACTQALLRDVMRLGDEYGLPELVSLGVERSLSLVPTSAMAAHFAGLPAEVQNVALVQMHVVMEDRPQVHVAVEDRRAPPRKEEASGGAGAREASGGVDAKEVEQWVGVAGQVLKLFMSLAGGDDDDDGPHCCHHRC